MKSVKTVVSPVRRDTSAPTKEWLMASYAKKELLVAKKEGSSAHLVPREHTLTCQDSQQKRTARRARLDTFVTEQDFNRCMKPFSAKRGTCAV